MLLHTSIVAGGDPHLSLVKNEAFVVEQPFDAHDPSITFEEFKYWAKTYIDGRGPRTIKTTGKDRFSKGDNELAVDTNTPSASGNQDDAVITGVSDQEWKQASRALRTAGWGAIFYLITTDILGPFSTPWPFAQMGCGPGIALYTVFSWIMWKAYLSLDS
ncbi:hypothetical protein QQZ08_008695 [Neonectria magnoliae]|uniref:Uncharacterized protein n=1 Tax=Neonectria magnoliae TaxID=2732573 RepID=A0ABR1HTA5_9HYPO